MGMYRMVDFILGYFRLIVSEVGQYKIDQLINYVKMGQTAFDANMFTLSTLNLQKSCCVRIMLTKLIKNYHPYFEIIWESKIFIKIMFLNHNFSLYLYFICSKNISHNSQIVSKQISV